MSSHELQAILFDMDGTIFDTETICEQGWIKTAKRFGQNFDHEDYKKIVGIRVDLAHQQAKERFGDDFPMDEFIAEKQAFIKQEKAKGLTIRKGFVDFFEACLKTNLPIGLVTSSSMSDVHNNFAQFTNENYLKYFQCIVSGEDVSSPKPSPECYLLALNKLGVEAPRTLVFEDSNPGCRSAISAKCKTVMMPDMLPSAADIIPHLYAEINDFTEAYKLLK